MRDTRQELRLRHAELRFARRPITVNALSLETGLRYMQAWHGVNKLGLEYVTSEKILETAYKGAAILCASRDRDGLATMTGIARERKVSSGTVFRFFKKNPALKRLWNVFDHIEAKSERCRRAAARLRKRRPEGALSRREIARELRWSVNTLNTYIRLHPKLIDELGIAYERTPKQRHM